MRPTVIFLAIGVFGHSLGAAPLPAQEFRAGAATSNITPFIGDDIIGNFSPIRSTHVHDELHARCLVLDDGKTRLALVVCDSLGIHRAVSDEARKLIAEKVQIPRECVLICATHTHSSVSALAEAGPPSEPMLDAYQQFLARRIVDGVTRAVNQLEAAEIGFQTAEAPEHVFNRRWTMRPGSIPENPFGGADLVQMNPPPGSPNLMDPAGPTDPTISILCVRKPGGAVVSVFASYSLHYVGGEKHGSITADYYGMFCEHLEKLCAADDSSAAPIAMLSNGTSGDINNINFRNPRPPKKPYEQMHFVAEDVAQKVYDAIGKIEFQPHMALAASYLEPAIAWRRPDEMQRQWAERTLAKGPPNSRDLPRIYAERTLSLAKRPEHAALPVQVLRIGDVCIGTLPCETFCEIGLDFKRRSPIRNAFLVSLSHGYFGYLPTSKQVALGGYETWLGTNQLEREASDNLLKVLLEMAEEVKAKEPGS